jgi:DNA repair protein RadC
MVVLQNSNIYIGEPAAVATVFQDLLSLEDRIDQDKEHVYVMHVNSRRQINLVELVAIGTLTDAKLHPRETYRRAVIKGTASIFLAHNHPSGDVTPSEADITVTKQLCKAGEILQIPMLDHIIFTAQNGAFFSFKDNKTQSTLQTRRKKYVMKNCRDGKGVKRDE